MSRACLALCCVALLPGLAVPRVASAAEGHDHCTGFVTALPHTIVAPGTWCLAANLQAGPGVDAVLRIAADDVVLDCNHFRIDGSAAGIPSPAPAIHAAGRSDLTIRRCHVRAFDVGIVIEPGDAGASRRHRIEDNRLDGIRHIGMSVIGDGSVVRGNRIHGLISRVDGQSAFGISTQGAVDVIDNTVTGVRAAGSLAVGIASAFNDGGSVRGNRVRDVQRGGPHTTTYGIRIDTGRRTVVRDNVVAGDGEPESFGLICDSSPAAVARDNSLLGFATGLVGCRDDGNLVRP